LNTEESSPENKETEDVVSDYYDGYQQLQLQSAETKIRKSRNTLFVVAGFTLIGNLIVLGGTNALDSTTVIIVLVMTGIFAGLGFMTKKQPMAAIIIGLVLYVGLWILDIIINGTERLKSGLLIKGIIIYFLVSGLKHAREAERIRRELESRK
jgi:Na+-transporting NADH:ubiquinone oxidoreductase subunit NqrD